MNKDNELALRLGVGWECEWEKENEQNVYSS